MNKKIVFILVSIIFIAILITTSVILNNKYNVATKQNNQINKEEKKMNVLKVTGKNFEEEVLKSEKTVLVDFYADWCGPCKSLSPIVDEVAEENENLKVVKVNVDEAQDIALKYQVMSIPTLVVIKNGQEANRSVGLVSKSKIIDIVK